MRTFGDFQVPATSRSPTPFHGHSHKPKLAQQPTNCHLRINIEHNEWSIWCR